MEQDKVSILFLAANPVNTPELELTKEYNYIDEEIQKGKYDDLFQLQQRQAITAGDIQNTLLRFRPKVVHFSGHGSAAGALVFEDRNGQGDEISPDALSNLFEIMNKDNNIQCVVLNACYSEKQAKAIAKHVDCVVGMKRAVTDAAALKFAGSFYNALAHGESIRTAFDLACNQLDLQHISEEKTPKLLTREGIDASTISFRPVPKRHDISNTSVQDVHPAGVNWTKWGVIGGIITGAITAIVALVPLLLPPTPSLSAEAIAPDSVNVGEVAQFGANIEGGSPPYEFVWKFGDGIQAELEDPSHGYNNSGSYKIILTVKDSKGTTKVVQRSLTVTQDTRPVVSISSSAAGNTTYGGEFVTLYGNKSKDPDGGGLDYRWEQTPLHDVILNSPFTKDTYFPAPNVTDDRILTFQLTVTDDERRNASKHIQILVKPKEASFTSFPSAVDPDLEVSFDYPTDWNKTVENNTITLTPAEDSPRTWDLAFPTYFSITVVNKSSDKSLDYYSSQYHDKIIPDNAKKDTMSFDISNPTKVEFITFDLDKIPAYKIFYNLTNAAGITQQHILTLIAYDDRLYVLHYAALPKFYASYLPDIERISNSTSLSSPLGY